MAKYEMNDTGLFSSSMNILAKALKSSNADKQYITSANIEAFCVLFIFFSSKAVLDKYRD